MFNIEYEREDWRQSNISCFNMFQHVSMSPSAFPSTKMYQVTWWWPLLSQPCLHPARPCRERHHPQRWQPTTKSTNGMGATAIRCLGILWKSVEVCGFVCWPRLSQKSSDSDLDGFCSWVARVIMNSHKAWSLQMLKKKYFLEASGDTNELWLQMISPSDQPHDSLCSQCSHVPNPGSFMNHEPSCLLSFPPQSIPSSSLVTAPMRVTSVEQHHPNGGPSGDQRATAAGLRQNPFKENTTGFKYSNEPEGNEHKNKKNKTTTLYLDLRFTFIENLSKQVQGSLHMKVLECLLKTRNHFM